MVVYGDVPLGAGLSSSAALEVAVVFGLDVTFDLRLDPIDAIRLCQRVEHRYAGVECGIMDQFVARLGRRGHALLLDCRSLEHDHVPLAVSAADVALVIADTRVSRELAASKYGERRMECRGAVSSIRERHPGVRSLRDVTVEMLVEHRAAMGETFYRRARHVVDENARVLQARDALADGSYERFGRLMQASHTSLRDLYEVSSAELDTLVDAAMRTDGVFGARMTGGGFGGCTVQLLRPTALEPLRDALTAAYMDRHGRRPSIYVVERNHHTERLQGP